MTPPTPWLAQLRTALLALPFAISLTPDPARASGAHQPGVGHAPLAQELRMAQDAERFRSTAQAFVARAMAGDGDAALKMLSQALRLRSGDDTIRRALDGQILPFFTRGVDLGRSVTVTRTTDAAGQAGYAFYMWLRLREGGEERPFTVYVVEEGGRTMVANVVPDRRVEGRHR